MAKDKPQGGYLLKVLISHIYASEPSYMETLRSRFPQLGFIGFAKEPPFPDEAREARVLLYGGLVKPVLSAVLNHAPKIDWIHTGTAGFDWLRVPEVEQRGIVVSRTLHAMDTPIAEYVLAAMLAQVKNVGNLIEAQSHRAWETPQHEELFGKTVGIVGAGSIGSRIAGYAKAFGMQVLGLKRSPEPVANFDAVYGSAELPRLLQASDFVVLACPLTPETHSMMGYAQLKQMKPTGYLINIARGALLVEADLIRALNEGLVAGAALDVFETEPLPPESPLWTTPKLMISPHASFRSPNVRGRVIEEFCANLERYLAGKPVKNTMKHVELGY